jgi:hypothetical protein
MKNLMKKMQDKFNKIMDLTATVEVAAVVNTQTQMTRKRRSLNSVTFELYKIIH